VRRFLRIILWLLAAIVLLAVGLFTYLRSADLSIYEDQIEGYLSGKIGHELSVDGLFELNFGSLTQLTAENVTLSNTNWPKADCRIFRYLDA